MNRRSFITLGLGTLSVAPILTLPASGADTSFCSSGADFVRQMKEHHKEELLYLYHDDGVIKMFFANKKTQKWTLAMAKEGSDLVCTMRDGEGYMSFNK